jgi:hypothetical protein
MNARGNPAYRAIGPIEPVHSAILGTDDYGTADH